MDFHLTLQTCFAYEDDNSCERTMPLSQRSMSHLKLKCKYATIRACAIVPFCIKGF